MRLLILTQTVDKQDSVLGFMHAWISEFAKQFEHITVICLRKGEYSLPPNVSVFSLGKEVGGSRIKYIFNFCRYVLRERCNYDAVFVHMNQEYILLGGFIWKLLGKRIYMWRNHYAGSLPTDLAAAFCTKIFCTSKFSYTAKYKKTVLMPVGVDTEVFKPVAPVARMSHSILFYARFAQSKRPDLLLEALGELHRRNILFSATFCGQKSDIKFYEQLKNRAHELGVVQQVRFIEGQPYAEGPALYSTHELFVNLSTSGMFDKTLFEAAGCECLVLAMSKDFAELVDEKFVLSSDTPIAIAGKLEKLIALAENEKQVLRGKMREIALTQSLQGLAQKLAKTIGNHD